MRGIRALSPLALWLMAHGSALYDAEVAYADYEIGRVLARLRKRGLVDDSLVILSSDHGEWLGEDGKSWDHCGSMHSYELNVPLMIQPTLMGFPLLGCRAGVVDGRWHLGNAVREHKNFQITDLKSVGHVGARILSLGAIPGQYANSTSKQPLERYSTVHPHSS